MARFLLIVIIVIVGGMSYLAVRYAKDAYMVLPMADGPENQLEEEIDSETDYQNWQEFASPSAAFKVLMPSIPQHVSDKSRDPKTKSIRKDDVYIAEKKNGTIFMIHAITYQSETEAKAAEGSLLQQFMQDMLASNPSNKLVASQPAVYKGQQSLDFVIENDSFYYNVREFLYENSLIVLSSISRKPLQGIKDFKFFINSFEFTPVDQKTQK